MEFGKFSLPPSSNWFYPHLLDVSVDGVIAYGSKSSIVVLENVKKNGKYLIILAKIRDTESKIVPERYERAKVDLAYYLEKLQL